MSLRRSRKVRTKIFDRRSRKINDLCFIVPAAEADGVGGVRRGDETARFIGRHHAALERETDARGLAKRSFVGGFDGTEVALSGDVKAYGLSNPGAEVSLEKTLAENFVAVVDALIGRVVVELVKKVADVMEQRGGDEFGVGAIVEGECGGL